MQPYAPRRIEFLGLLEHSGWRLKQYEVLFGSEELDRSSFAAGIERVLAELPQPAVGTGRLGVGFLIMHRGRTGDYAVLAWWDRENELPLRLAVRSPGVGERWRAAAATESICVWDLEIIAFERDAYVDTVLSPRATGTEEAARHYLERTLRGPGEARG